MERIKLGNNGTEISKMGLGTWAIGGGPAWNGDLDKTVCVDTIHRAVELGINLIDTAPGYNFGKSEKIVGEALEGLNREDVVVETKFGLVWDWKGTPFNKVGDRQLYRNLSPDSIKAEMCASLQRLGTDYVDIYMSHWQSLEPYYTPIAETMKTLMDLKEQGVIRAIGAANVTADDVKEYLSYGELDIIQAKYNLLDRNAEKELFELCRSNGIVLQVYSPLEQGLLTGGFKKGYVPTGARANKKWWQPGNLDRVVDMLDGWKPLCAKYNCSLSTLSLAWVVKQADFISVLSGCTSPSQADENVGALNIELSQEDADKMRSDADALGM